MVTTWLSLGVSVTGMLGGCGARVRVSHVVGFASPAEMLDEAEGGHGTRVRHRSGIAVAGQQ